MGSGMGRGSFLSTNCQDGKRKPPEGRRHFLQARQMPKIRHTAVRRRTFPPRQGAGRRHDARRRASCGTSVCGLEAGSDGERFGGGLRSGTMPSTNIEQLAKPTSVNLGGEPVHTSGGQRTRTSSGDRTEGRMRFLDLSAPRKTIFDADGSLGVPVIHHRHHGQSSSPKIRVVIVLWAKRVPVKGSFWGWTKISGRLICLRDPLQDQHVYDHGLTDFTAKRENGAGAAAARSLTFRRERLLGVQSPANTRAKPAEVGRRPGGRWFFVGPVEPPAKLWGQ